MSTRKVTFSDNYGTISGYVSIKRGNRKAKRYYPKSASFHRLMIVLHEDNFIPLEIRPRTTVYTVKS